MKANDAYFFFIFPKFIQTKGFVIDRKLPQFSISAFIDSLKIDEITVIPTKEQTMYHTIFWLNSGRLEFEQSYQESSQLVRIEIFDETQMVGRIFLSTNDYIKCMEEGKEHYFCERVKISESYEMDFELFLAGTRYEMEELLLQYRGESDIRTPITKRSQQRKDDSQLNFDILKLAQSQLYSPEGNNSPDSKCSIFQRIDQEESLNSSLPQSAPPTPANNFSFKIQLKEVPPAQMKKSTSRVQFCDSGEVRRLGVLGWKEKATLYLFTGLSLGMIYFSMIPIRKI